ncbi:MAG TPA: hypothetical protein VFE79_10485 [Paraburkholderia sp.]|nr:hypothetical protein [Paraburkholderia sp.]
MTGQGLANLRGLARRECVALIFERCAHPLYRDLLRDDYRDSLRAGGDRPHRLDRAFVRHTRLLDTGSMLTTV